MGCLNSSICCGSQKPMLRVIIFFETQFYILVRRLSVAPCMLASGCVSCIAPRWTNGKGPELKRSSAYPTWFGRAFAFAQQCMDYDLKEDALETAIRRFAQRMVDSLPPPGQMSAEETCCRVCD